MRCLTFGFFMPKIFRPLPWAQTPVNTGRRKYRPNCHSRSRRSYVAAHDFLRAGRYGWSVEKLFVAATVLVRAAACLRVVFPRRPLAAGPTAFAGRRRPEVLLCTQTDGRLHVARPLSQRKKPRITRSRVL